MNVALAMQVLSATVASMIRRAIGADDIVLGSATNKGVYNSLVYLCENMNGLIDICNGRHTAHTPENGLDCQHELLHILEWFSRWKQLHDKRVEMEEADEYNFFANETWKCIQSLILAHVSIIQIYCIEKKEKINPRVINTDVVEWFFGDARACAVARRTNCALSAQTPQIEWRARLLEAGTV